MKEDEFLCPKCNLELAYSHIVQCSGCQTIIDTIPAEEGEELIVINVDNCENCFSLQKSEMNFESFFTNSF